MSIKKAIIKALENLIGVIKNTNKSLNSHIKCERRNKMMKAISTNKKNNKRPRMPVTGFYCFMRSKKTESTSQVIEKISM